MKNLFEMLAREYRHMGTAAQEILLRLLVMAADIAAAFGWMGILAAALLASPWWLLLLPMYPSVILADKAANAWLDIYLEEKENKWVNRKL